MKPDLEAIRARAEKATAGPWTHCGQCECDNVAFKDGPVCNVTKGEWGDEIPALRIDGDGKAEAYMKMYGYGEVSNEQFLANRDFIAHSRSDIPALLAYIDSLERVREAAKNHSCVMGRHQLDAALAAVGEK